MYFPIKIDLDDLIEEFDLDLFQVQDLASELTNNITNTFYNALKQKVNSTLKQTRDLYLKSIDIKSIDPLTREIVLKGWLPNALEEGTPLFDMKDGFSKARNVRIGKDGDWYTTIKFPFGINNEQKQKIPKEVEKVLKKGPTPLKEIQIPETYRLHQIKEIAGRGTYQHKNSIYTGLQKDSQVEEKGSYNTFRRVGAKSDANSWFHPGFTKRDFFGKALNDIQAEIPILADTTIDNFLKSQGF